MLRYIYIVLFGLNAWPMLTKIFLIAPCFSRNAVNCLRMWVYIYIYIIKKFKNFISVGMHFCVPRFASAYNAIACIKSINYNILLTYTRELMVSSGQ
jgi:hypothetical protein